MSADIGWSETGYQQAITERRQELQNVAFEAKVDRAVQLGEHLWIASLAFYVSPPLKQGTLLDADGIATGPHVGCYLCEEPWSERIGHRRCKPVGMNGRPL